MRSDTDEGLSRDQIALSRGQKLRAGFGGATPEIKPPDRKNVHYRVTNQSPIDVMRAKDQITEPMRQAGERYRRAYEASQMSAVGGRDLDYVDRGFGPRDLAQPRLDAMKERERLAEDMTPLQFWLLDRVAGALWSLNQAARADQVALVHPMGRRVTNSNQLMLSLQEALQIAARFYGLEQDTRRPGKIEASHF